ncbi:1,4-alpha-glucan branching protein GlgB [Schleiferia thermophila]|uniref:1,4-alpha-glucan branching protein GlgB n=1 Tax=Schleiferia thermophila TaxID=884107 RepID=UPI0004E75535|nr:1,4-alpha-glucan branching protein GlgB [Schleiferia thermophila]KFD38439.1 glycogen branching protein [Schleiferia thermophila str. Yellowstone]PMB31203.1 glycogen-branching enzyme [Fischerella thermalis CCMEE 5319]
MSTIPHSLYTDFDISLFRSGHHFKMYEKMGAHPLELDGQAGTYFSVWAPNARNVAVIGDFNFWSKDAHALFPRWDGSGIWEGFVPGALQGHRYKYLITTQWGYQIEKADPYARLAEIPPKTASIIWKDDYRWNDQKWKANLSLRNSLDCPMSIYEVHLGSWMRNSDGTSLSYRQMIEKLVPYVKKMGYTHVEFMPVMEHPFFGSWGYQITGYYAPSSRYGSPEDFKALIDAFHSEDIGVILDWVPSHFPGDLHGLVRFDGTALYEHEDPRKGFHPDWNSFIFNYGRYEVRSFLFSNAMYWIEQFHADGLRVDAVASMLYLDYSRKPGEWVPNPFGGKENLEAISFLRELNEFIYKEHPDIQMIAEESTAFPKVSRPVYEGGLGFGLKWMMGWMHDTLNYFKRDPIFRRYHHGEITFSLVYAYTENFTLPFSHDEVVHGKGSLLSRMPGDLWQKFANLRAIFGYMFTHPGSKLMFMGSEFGQTSEWNHDASVRWDQLENLNFSKGLLQLIIDLNKLYREQEALYKKQYKPEGFEWIEVNDWQQSVLSYVRKSGNPDQDIVVIANFTPIIRKNYRIGVPSYGQWKLILNTDDAKYGGSGMHKNHPKISSESIHWHGREDSISIDLPPLAVLIFKKIKK